MPYAASADLPLGQLSTRLPTEVNINSYLNAAADHIDARLGHMYVTPFVVSGANSLPSHQVKLLKNINAKRAAGQIIMATTIATEDSLVHQYALWLIQEAEIELQAIQDGIVKLSAPPVDSDGVPLPDIDDPDDADAYARVPTAVNIDMYSATAAFEENIMQGSDATWTPRSGERFSTLPYPRGQ